METFGTLGTIPTLTLGQFDQRVITDLSTLFGLYGAVDSTTSNSTPRKPNDSSGYVVPGGKTFTIKGMSVQFSQAFGGDSSINVGYADNDVSILAAGTPTNRILLGRPDLAGGAALVNFGLVYNSCTVGEEKSVWVDNFVVPAGKYPLIFMNSAGSPVVQVVLYGVEA